MTFPTLLTTLRRKANLTNQTLAEKAGVPRSLIAGLQSGKRRVGEMNARMIGEALGLTGRDLEHFIYQAIDTCTEKLLQDSQTYPAELLNLLPQQLRASGVLPDELDQYHVIAEKQTTRAVLFLKDGTVAEVTTEVTRS